MFIYKFKRYGIRLGGFLSTSTISEFIILNVGPRKTYFNGKLINKYDPLTNLPVVTLHNGHDAIIRASYQPGFF